MFCNNTEYSQYTDYGPKPVALNLWQMASANKNYRTTIWTGEHLQTTLMQIKVNDDIGLEIHQDTDQLIIVVDGCAMVTMGKECKRADYHKNVKSGYGILIPAGTWHNIVNTGNRPLKLISVYAPPEHPHGTVHVTKADAQKSEQRY